jgi:hypothetical protein
MTVSPMSGNLASPSISEPYRHFSGLKQKITAVLLVANQLPSPPTRPSELFDPFGHVALYILVKA